MDRLISRTRFGKNRGRHPRAFKAVWTEEVACWCDDRAGAATFNTSATMAIIHPDRTALTLSHRRSTARRKDWPTAGLTSSSARTGDSERIVFKTRLVVIDEEQRFACCTRKSSNGCARWWMCSRSAPRRYAHALPRAHRRADMSTIQTRRTTPAVETIVTQFERARHPRRHPARAEPWGRFLFAQRVMTIQTWRTG